MSSPTTSEDGDCEYKPLVDYVMFQKFQLQDTSEHAKVLQVSDSYGIATVFRNKTGEYPVRKGANRKFVEIAPSFVVSCGEVRAGGHGLGHGIAYEGCWVTYKDEVMCGKDEVPQGENKVVYGTSRLELRSGKSFTVLCREVAFRKWFARVLNGDFSEHDFDTLPLDILISLTSPSSSGSLASENPAGLNPSAGLLIAPANNGPSEDHTGDHGAAVSTLQVVSTFQATPGAAASLTTENQPTNQHTAVDKDENVILIQDDSDVARHSDLRPSTRTQASNKRRKTSSPEIINLLSDDEDVTVTKEPSAATPSSINATRGSRHARDNAEIITQNHKLVEENRKLKLKESLTTRKYELVIGRNKTLAQEIQSLRQEVETCKASELHAHTKATEASGKIEELTRLKQKLMDERENFKLSVMGAVRDLIDKDGDLNGKIKDDDHAGKIKDEDHTG